MIKRFNDILKKYGDRLGIKVLTDENGYADGDEEKS